MTKFIVNGKQGYKTYHDWKAFWGMKGAPSTPPVPPGPDLTEPFYIESRGNAMNVSIRKGGSSAPTISVEYSFDKTTWQSLGSTSTAALTINVPAGGKVWLRANTNGWASGEYAYNYITTSTRSNVGGNIMSLLYGNDFTGQSEFPSTSTAYTFCGLFKNGYSSIGNIVDASELLLPATTLTEYCYRLMFRYCQYLTTAPSVLPATTLANYCYREMFSNCNSLTSAPTLPAITLMPGCYMNMFEYCGSLTTAPELPATTLANDCYNYMFFLCSSLTTAPELPATTLANYCYYGMFSNCYSLTQAPVLPATTLVSGCYTNMFANCSILNYIKCLAREDENYTYDFRSYCGSWVDGVSDSGTFIASDNYSSGWYWGKDGVPENWTTETESGNYFEPTSEGGGGTQIFQANGFTVYEMGGEQGGYPVQANGASMEVPDFSGNDYCFAMMKISADQDWGMNYVYMTPYLGSGVKAFVSYGVVDDGTCPFSYNSDDEWENYEYSLTDGDSGNQISSFVPDGNCVWVKFIKNQGSYEGYTPYITMNF